MDEQRPEVNPVNRRARDEGQQMPSLGLEHVLRVLPARQALGRAVQLNVWPG